MQTPSLQTQILSEKLSSDEISKPGDFYIRDLEVYNSKKVHKGAIILNCPFCGMTIGSTFQTVSLTRIKRFLSKIGLPFGVTVTPHITCPFGTPHSFLITNGRVKAIK